MVKRVEHRILSNASYPQAQLACKNLRFDSSMDVPSTSKSSECHYWRKALERYPFRLRFSISSLPQLVLQTAGYTLLFFCGFHTQNCTTCSSETLQEAQGQENQPITRDDGCLKETLLPPPPPHPYSFTHQGDPLSLQLMRERADSKHTSIPSLQSTGFALQQRTSSGYCNL